MIPCLRCLEKTPEERYPSAAALAQDLERFLKGEEIEAREADLWQHLRRWARREPALASRLVALAGVAVIEQANYLISQNVTLSVHLKVMVVLALWALASVAFQRLLRKEQWSDLVRVAWVGADAVLLTVVLSIADSLESPAVGSYALLVAGSGLWFRARLVWFATAISEAAYSVLVLDCYRRQAGLEYPHRHVIFAAALAVLGYVVAYQVKRVRALSRYYEHRPLP